MRARGRAVRRLAAACVLGALLALASGAFAQRKSVRRPRPGASGSPAVSLVQSTGPRALGSRVAPVAALRALGSGSRDERVRGVRRLGAQADLASIELLLRVVDESPSLAADPAVRLETVRAAAPFAARDPVRPALARWAGDEGGVLLAGDGLAAFSREQAAMALAASNDTRALEVLVALVVAGSGPAEIAARALEAHPPANLEPLLTSRALGAPRLVELLGALGDLRATQKLRETVDKGDLPARAAALVALARLGDETAAGVARGWLAQPGSTHPQREAAARALVALRATDAPRAVAILLADPATRSTALRLAFEAPSPQLAPSLAGYLTIAPPAERALLFVALGRASGPVAARTLARLALGPVPDSDAVFALASCRDAAAAESIGKLLAAPATRRLGARASLVRLSELGEAPDGLREALRAMASSREAADRQVAAFGLALTGEASVEQLAGSADAGVVRGACRAALALGAADRQACARRIQDRGPSAVRDALASALRGDVEPANVSTRALLDWAEEPVPASAVFARALGPRDGELIRPRIRRLLASGDPLLRAQVALGLGRSAEPSAASVLADAWALELDPLVRRAIVRALSAHAHPRARALLRATASLDPDLESRELARLALGGMRLDTPPAGNRIAWIALEAPRGGAAGLGRPALVVPAGGFAVAAVADDDGWLLVPGLVSGEARVQLAPSRPPEQPTEP
jgi:hypothetical protein